MCFPRQLPTTERKLLSLLSSTCVIRVVLSVSYLFSFLLCDEFLKMCFLSMPQLSKYVSIRSNERFRKVLQSWRYLAPTESPCWNWRGYIIKLYEPHLGKEKPVVGNIEPLLGITKPAEGLNKPCQGNVNGRKSFAAEGFKLNVKMPFISQTYTKAVAISFRQSHTRIRNLVKYHPRVVFTESFHAMVSTDEEVCWIQGHCTGILKIYAKIWIIQALMWTSSQKQD